MLPDVRFLVMPVKFVLRPAALMVRMIFPVAGILVVVISVES